ncbi:translation initiation factor IF-2 [Triticum aestivum]|uniref:translation initiation factor IF-2 n=1 Tax=Triticum aestivum TaxID=4565 RepID=UPI000844B56D|nr:translation initiation factor IF-2-like [Triticum aestivum]
MESQVNARSYLLSSPLRSSAPCSLHSNLVPDSNAGREIMASTVVSMARSMLGAVISVAASAAATEMSLLIGVRKDIWFMKDELETMHAFLVTAEATKENNRLLQVWAKQVRDLAYGIEDCLDEFMVLTLKTEFPPLPPAAAAPPAAAGRRPRPPPPPPFRPAPPPSRPPRAASPGGGRGGARAPRPRDPAFPISPRRRRRAPSALAQMMPAAAGLQSPRARAPFPGQGGGGGAARLGCGPAALRWRPAAGVVTAPLHGGGAAWWCWVAVDAPPAQIRARRAPSGPLGAGPPAWSRCLRRGEEKERLGLGASAPMACRQQREGGSFTGPWGLGRACGPTGLVCSCYCVRTATVADGGGGALPRADGADALVPALILRRAVLTLRCHGETAWRPHDRVGAGWWLVWWRDPERPRCGLGSGETPVGVADSGAVAPVGAA